jgi:hypothetical protein
MPSTVFPSLYLLIHESATIITEHIGHDLRIEVKIKGIHRPIVVITNDNR